MFLSRYASPVETSVVLVYLRVIIRLFAIMLLVPLGVALISQEWFYSGLFGVLAAVAYLLGSFTARHYVSPLALREALIVTALAYPLCGYLGALVFWPVAPLLDGFFESISGLTTTGLSILPVEHLPVSLLFFRAYLQWIGGAGIIVLSLALLFGPGQASLQLYVAESTGTNLVGSVVSTARLVVLFYLLLTFAGWLALMGSGMHAVDALLYIMAALSTGGFSPYANSLGPYTSPFILATLQSCMFLGAINFSAYYLLYSRKLSGFFREPQVRALLTITVFASLSFGMLRGLAGPAVSTTFDAISALTTTGFNATEVTMWSDQEKLLSVSLMSLGGATGSTAGGLKLLRGILIWRIMRWLLWRDLLPEEAKLPIKYGNMVVSDSELKQLCGVVFFYVLLLFGSTFLLSIAGFPAVDALFESASALATTGLSTGITSPALVFWGKLILIFDMWVGRLEIVPVLVTLYPSRWHWKRSTT